MTVEKGLDPVVADKIGEYVKHKGKVWYSGPSMNLSLTSLPGGVDLLTQLESDASLISNKSAKQGLTDMGILFTLLNAYGVLDKVEKKKTVPCIRIVVNENLTDFF